MNGMWQLACTSQSLNGPSLHETVPSGRRVLENCDGAESLNAETRTIESLTLGCSIAFSTKCQYLAGYSYNSQVSNSCSYRLFARE